MVEVLAAPLPRSQLHQELPSQAHQASVGLRLLRLLERLTNPPLESLVAARREQEALQLESVSVTVGLQARLGMAAAEPAAGARLHSKVAP